MGLIPRGVPVGRLVSLVILTGLRRGWLPRTPRVPVRVVGKGLIADGIEYHVVGGGLEERTCGEGGDGDLVGRDWEQREMDRNRTVREADLECRTR